MSDSRDRIAQLRTALDVADNDLVKALDARARAVRDLAAIKEAEPTAFVQFPTSGEVVARLREMRRDFPANGLEPVVREVLSASAEMIAPVKVGVLGPAGGLAHAAARAHFGSRAIVQAFDQVGDVFAALERQAIGYGVVPLETSSDGTLFATLSGLAAGRAKINAERSLLGEYHLFSKTGNAGDVEKIYGAASAFAACTRALKNEFSRAPQLDMQSGVVSAELAAEDHGAAAVGPELLGELFGLRIVRRNVEDDANVQMRFVILGHDSPRRTGRDRTMLALTLGEEPGSLYAALQPFAEREINLTRLESRRVASSGLGELFFLELDGHVSDRPVLTAIEEVRGKSRNVRVLGSYPRPQSE
jgi:chorismate mutase/prephenate dehydratase